MLSDDRRKFVLSGDLAAQNFAFDTKARVIKTAASSLTDSLTDARLWPYSPSYSSLEKMLCMLKE